MIINLKPCSEIMLFNCDILMLTKETNIQAFKIRNVQILTLCSHPGDIFPSPTETPLISFDVPQPNVYLFCFFPSRGP